MVCEERFVVFDGVEGLVGFVFFDEVVGLEVFEDILDDVGVVIGWGVVEDVGFDMELVVDIVVEGVVFCVEGWRVNVFFESFGFGGSVVFVLEDWFVSLVCRERCCVGIYGVINE